MKSDNKRKGDFMNFNDVFRIVGLVVCWGLAILLGLIVFTTLASGLMAFASTGIGAVILTIVGWKLWKEYFSEK